MQTDFFIHDQGSLVILIPATEAAEQWTAANLPADAMRYGQGVVIEPRYVPDIVEGILADSLTIQ